MGRSRWLVPTIVLVLVVATQAVRIIGLASRDAGAALRDVAIGVAVLGLLGLGVAAFVWVRGAGRAQRRRALAGKWIDDVLVHSNSPDRETLNTDDAPRDFAVGIEDDKIKLWGSAEAVALEIPFAQVRSVEVVRLQTSRGRESSVELTTAAESLNLVPSSIFGNPPRDRDVVELARHLDPQSKVP